MRETSTYAGQPAGASPSKGNEEYKPRRAARRYVRPASDYQTLLGEGSHDDQAIRREPTAGSDTPTLHEEGDDVTELT